MKQISITNPFLQNILFLKDVYKFSLIGHNLGLDETQIYSDEESYMFILGKNHKPIWLWSIDNISEEKILEITDCLEYFSNNGLTSSVCKNSLYSKLTAVNGNLQNEEFSGC